MTRTHGLFLLFWIVCACLVGATSTATSQPQSRPAQTQPADSQPAGEPVVVAGETFHLELALNNDQRAKGLSGRTQIETGRGMLFIFPRPQSLSFWMADCMIDIDLLYLNARGVVVGLHKMKKEPLQGAQESRDAYLARLKRYETRTPAKYVVELAPGSIDRLKLKVGDKVELDIDKLGKMAK